MRLAAVLALVAFVAYCAALALAKEPKLDAELAQAHYFVAAPISTVAVSTPTGDANPSALTAPAYPLRDDPAAVVAVSADRGVAIQVTATVPPPAPTGLHGLPLAPVGLSACESASFYRAQAGLPARFDGIIWRESRCDPTASNWCCSGLAQVHRLWVSSLAGCGVYVRADLYDPQRNMCAAAYVLAVQGIDAWSTA